MNVHGHEGWKVKPAHQLQVAVHGYFLKAVGSRKVIPGRAQFCIRWGSCSSETEKGEKTVLQKFSPNSSPERLLFQLNQYQQIRNPKILKIHNYLALKVTKLIQCSVQERPKFFSHLIISGKTTVIKNLPSGYL